MTAKDVIIVGGSLTGLMHGIMLHRSGHNVLILEKDPGRPESHMAGLAIATNTTNFLEQYDRVDQPLGIPSECWQILDRENNPREFMRARRILTSWDALYYRLRANFDGLESEYCRRPSDLKNPNWGTASFDAGRRVTDVTVTAEKVSVQVAGSGTNEKSTYTADLLLGADGLNSVVRRTFVPEEKAKVRYGGYVAWRGVVPENDVSKETRRILQDKINYFVLPSGEHIIIYYIPGEHGSLEVGERLVNFVWYSNTSLKSLDELMTDVDGHRHHSTVPKGKVRPELWEKQCKESAWMLSRSIEELVSKITQPFLQVISDYYSPQASFGSGKCFLVGEARTMFRPHIAFSTNQAAFDCSMVAKLIKGEITTAEWERQVVSFSHLHWRRSIWFGEWFRHPLYISIFAGLRYWTALASHAIIQHRWSGSQI